jgi:hypothetical protein
MLDGEAYGPRDLVGDGEGPEVGPLRDPIERVHAEPHRGSQIRPGAVARVQVYKKGT